MLHVVTPTISSALSIDYRPPFLTSMSSPTWAGPYEGYPDWGSWTAQNVATFCMVAFALFSVSQMVCLSIRAEYGRFSGSAKGFWSLFPLMHERLGWVLMESPSCVLFFIFYMMGSHRGHAAPVAMHVIWQVHYFHRTFVFPFLMQGGSAKAVSSAVVLMGFAFNTLNSFANATFIADKGYYPDDWLKDPRFIVGTLVFALGFFINKRSDYILQQLRKEHGALVPVQAVAGAAVGADPQSGSNTAPLLPVFDETDAEAAAGAREALVVDAERGRVCRTAQGNVYWVSPVGQTFYIPHGFLFEYVASPNYLGELVTWTGYAILSWSLPALAFVLLTSSNLGPRAGQTRKWYESTFGAEYTQLGRKSLIPFVW